MGNMTTIVVNKKLNEPYDIYIGRGSIWGNPYIIGQDGDRDDVISKFTDYLYSNKELLSKIHILKGKRLACFCKQKRKFVACHGDVYVRLIDTDTTIGDWCCGSYVDGIYTRGHWRT
jgi:hypothetical protein